MLSLDMSWKHFLVHFAARPFLLESRCSDMYAVITKTTHLIQQTISRLMEAYVITKNAKGSHSLDLITSKDTRKNTAVNES
jgi:hypothetical protein